MVFFFWMNPIRCREKGELGKKTIREMNVFFLDELFLDEKTASFGRRQLGR